ncbi:MAG: bifunctional adenosylcobinamide kinase/adenosylcobinamide-phosphate guanylyltransferase [Eggerthellaceae bacterium]|nr:bifunctional adenosylcobinamide kinase/adenosylcobinamide-phosphate guanylyltransferase [Eggerthellaceae bacterium]
MVIVVGGYASGKRTYVKSLGYEDVDMSDGVLDERPVLLNLQDLIAAASGDVQPEALAQSVADKEVVTCCEIGNGIVPLDPGERAWREQVGRTLNILSERADRVVRMVCGIPVTLK